MKQSLFTIKENVALTHDIMKMVLSGDTTDITRPGQFVNVLIEGQYLRRPISVNDAIDGELTLIYKIVGVGTEKMAKMTPGEKLDILTGLGNGYDTEKSGDRPLLIGGGVGVPPLYMLAKQLCAKGCDVTIILGFRSARDVFYKDEFEALGAKVFVTTEDGTAGTKGFVTGVFGEAGDYTHTYSCGPEPMLRAVYNTSVTSGQYSFEERMGCGFGACMGCSCKTLYGNKRICKDGPVLVKEEIVWEK